MTELQEVELDLFKKFIEICDKHKLDWFVDGGTLLGAVRHKGFIPWDDDIDILMPRVDYDKLISLYDEFEYPYFLQCSNTEQGYDNFKTHIKLRNSETTCEISDEVWWDGHKGAFIDIFPLDQCGKGKVGCRCWGLKDHLIWDIDWYRKLTLLDFEDIVVRAPIGYEQRLEKSYGEDWRTPKQAPSCHEIVTCDLHTPYKEYFKKKGCELLAVIIPVYHSRETLPRALDSLVLQTKKMFMVAIVNDADGEDYSDIVEEYRRRGLKISYFEQEKNQGPGPARQRGIDEMKMCKYIMFLDSDDMYSPVAVEVMTRAIQQQDYDVVMGNTVIGQIGKRYERNNVNDTCITWVWSKIYRRQYLVDNNIRFFNNIRVSEDVAFSLLAWHCTEKAGRLDQDIYYWCDNKKSLTRVNGGTQFDLDNLTDFVTAQCYGLKGIKERTGKVSLKLIMLTLRNIYAQVQTNLLLGASEKNFMDELYSLRNLPEIYEWREDKENWQYLIGPYGGIIGTEIDNGNVLFYRERFIDWYERCFCDDIPEKE